jgi:hypothetical protein
MSPQTRYILILRSIGEICHLGHDKYVSSDRRKMSNQGNMSSRGGDVCLLGREICLLGQGKYVQPDREIGLIGKGKYVQSRRRNMSYWTG